MRAKPSHVMAAALLGAILLPGSASAAVVVTREFAFDPFSWSYDASTRGVETIYEQLVPIDSFASVLGQSVTNAADPSMFTGLGHVTLRLGYVEEVGYRVTSLARGQSAATLRAIVGVLSHTDGTSEQGSNAGGTGVTCLTIGGCAGETGNLGTFDAPDTVKVKSRPLGLGGLDVSGFAVGLYATTRDFGRVTFNSTTRLRASVDYTLDTLSSSAPVPEPATWMMMLTGFAALGIALRHQPCSARRLE